MGELYPRNPADIAPAYQNNVFKFGRGTLDTTRHILWDGPVGAYTGFFASEVQLEALSDSADDGDGTAAIELVVTGQGDDGLEITDEINLNGITPVALNKLFKIVYRMYIKNTNDTSEITGPNHGTITVREVATPANIAARIGVAMGQTLMCIYRVPSDKWGKFKRVRGYPASGKVTTLTVFVRNNIGRGNAWTVGGTVEIPSGGAPADIDLSESVRFLTPGTDIIVMGEVDSTTGVASANFDIDLEDL